VWISPYPLDFIPVDCFLAARGYNHNGVAGFSNDPAGHMTSVLELDKVRRIAANR